MFEQEQSIINSDVSNLVQTATDQINKSTLVISQQQTQISSLQSQLAKRVYDDLAYGPWWANSKAQVGGSGKGTVQQAKNVFTLIPDVIAGVDNYFDCYFSREVPPKATDKIFQLTNSWMLKTSADVTACRCLEEELRHVLPGGYEFVKALQLDFADNALRIFGHTEKWFPTGAAMPKFIPGNWYNVVLNAHHDDVNIIYDSIIINERVINLSSIPPIKGFTDSPAWAEEMKIALQLDGKNLRYDAHYKDTKLIIG